MGYIERQNAWTAANRDRINLLVPKGQKEAIKAAAESRGMSLNAYVNRAIEEQMRRDRQFTTPTDDAKAAFLAKAKEAQPTQQAKPIPKQAPPAPKPEPDKIDWRDLCMKAKAAQEEKMKEEKDT